MTELANKFTKPTALQERALQQAGRELLLAQSSDWPFILRTGTSPDYATKRVKDHLHRFLMLYEQLTAKKIDEPWLRQIEQMDNIFPKLNYRLWATEEGDNKPDRQKPCLTALDISTLVINMYHYEDYDDTDLRNNFGRISEWLEKGETIQLLKRGKPFARVVPESTTEVSSGAWLARHK